MAIVIITLFPLYFIPLKESIFAAIGMLYLKSGGPYDPSKPKDSSHSQSIQNTPSRNDSLLHPSGLGGGGGGGGGAAQTLLPHTTHTTHTTHTHAHAHAYYPKRYSVGVLGQQGSSIDPYLPQNYGQTHIVTSKLPLLNTQSSTNYNHTSLNSHLYFGSRQFSVSETPTVTKTGYGTHTDPPFSPRKLKKYRKAYEYRHILSLILLGICWIIALFSKHPGLLIVCSVCFVCLFCLVLCLEGVYGR